MRCRRAQRHDVRAGPGEGIATAQRVRGKRAILLGVRR
jgi:hypothetical protein